MPDIRSAEQLNSIPMKGLLGSIHSYYAAASGGLSSWTAETDVPGATVSVVVAGSNSTVIIIGTFDCAIGSGSTTITGMCNWNGGSDQSQEAVFGNSAGVNVRGTVGQSWVLTGISAGTYTAKLRAACTSSNSANLIRQTHTTITVLVIENS